MTDINNQRNIIDSRDIIARIEDLELEKGDADQGCFPAESQEELTALKELADEAGDFADWRYGEMLIRESYFENYAQELAEELGMMPEDASWPATCINWEQAANELQMDYTSVEFDGATYWIRS